jgi:hypothetical protein
MLAVEEMLAEETVKDRCAAEIHLRVVAVQVEVLLRQTEMGALAQVAALVAQQVPQLFLRQVIKMAVQSQVLVFMVLALVEQSFQLGET